MQNVSDPSSTTETRPCPTWCTETHNPREVDRCHLGRVLNIDGIKASLSQFEYAEGGLQLVEVWIRDEADIDFTVAAATARGALEDIRWAVAEVDRLRATA